MEIDPGLDSVGSHVMYPEDGQREPETGPHRIHHTYTAPQQQQQPQQQPPQQPNTSIPASLPSDEQTKIRRAAKACANCRKHKLRCLGGEPCRRCQRAGIACDFSGRPAPPPAASVTPTHPSTSAANASVTNARVTALETSVTQILGHLEALRDGLRPLERLVHGSPRAEEQLRPTGVRLDREREDSRARYDSQERYQPLPSAPRTVSPFPGYATDRSRIDQLAMAAAQQLPVYNSSSEQREQPATVELAPINGGNQAHDTQLPGLSIPPREPVPQREMYHLPPLSGPSSTDSLAASTHSSRTRLSLRDLAPPPTDPDITASSRLKDFAHRFDPPFRAITFNPRVWENREVDPTGASRAGSRRMSPVGKMESREEDRASAEIERATTSERTTARYPETRREAVTTRDDPISNGILSERMAWALFQQYATHVHAFMPIFEMTNLFAFYESTRAKSSFLFSVILSISARFTYRRPSAQTAGAPLLEIDPQTFDELADTAESHLARTLLRKQHALTDVQATLLMANWGLRSGGGGPDAWILTGHAFRMARRLGMHLDDVLYAREQHLWIGEQGQRRVDKYIARRRVWLALSVYDCLFSHGFGRPPSALKMDAVDTGGFLNSSVARFEQNGGRATIPDSGKDRIVSAATGDVYISCQVELLQIAGDFRREMDQIKEQAEAQASMNRPAGDGMINAIITMCRRLTQRLDHWEERWLTKTPLGQFLRPIAPHVQIPYQHIRLCINAVALKPLSSRPSSSHGPTSATNPAAQMSQAEEACLGIAINAAVTVIRLHREAVTMPESVFSYATDYISLTLPHAALFLICAWKQGAKVDRGLVHHSLVQAIDAAEFSERSHTKLISALGRRMRELAAEAGFTDLPPSSSTADDTRAAGPGFDPLSSFMVSADAHLSIPVDLDVVGQMGSWFPGENMAPNVEGGFSWH